MIPPVGAAPREVSTPYPEGFVALDNAYRLNPPTQEEIAFFGRYAISGAVLLATPPDVVAADEVLTNPSQIEKIYTSVGGVYGEYDFAYFRREPVREHLGKTRSVPYLILKGEGGEPRLVPFEAAKTLEGEDPRVMQNVKIRGRDGTVRSGWCVSTVVATPKADNPADVEKIEQVFYWGETLGTLEPVLRVPDLKNTTIYPVDGADETSLHVFGRPHPHISYCRVESLSQITEDRILSSPLVTTGFFPSNVHGGVNLVKGTSDPSRLELDVHEACAPLTAGRKVLHYRLARYGFELPSSDFPDGHLTLLGVLATRDAFPEAPPKPPENGVADYTDILYGSMGTTGRMVTGVSDRHVGLASVTRVS